MSHLPIRWLIAGMTSGWAVAELRELFPNLNFHLITSAALHRHSMAAATNKELMAQRFRQRINQLEEFRTGTQKAARLPRPDEWPTFGQIKKEPQ